MGPSKVMIACKDKWLFVDWKYLCLGFYLICYCNYDKISGWPIAIDLLAILHIVATQTPLIFIWFDSYDSQGAFSLKLSCDLPVATWMGLTWLWGLATHGPLCLEVGYFLNANHKHAPYLTLSIQHASSCDDRVKKKSEAILMAMAMSFLRNHV